MDQESFQTALLFAAQAHAGQRRKGGQVPYITHVVGVAESLVYFYPGNTALAVAGLLHDLVEDTAVTQDDLQARFGPAVTALVMAVTKPDDDSLSFNEKRRATLTALTPERPDVLRLKAADALSNLSAIRRDLLWTGERAWDKFKASKEESLQYYRDILTRVRQGLADEALVVELERELEAVTSLSP
ncbi:MAG: HD domain-containing protein [Deinococcota bacterium]|jgi:(p)ppGpp synthase/HD superfamily hydrolase|nr:HD domain-containing protein [Deinococcota bacterium]